MPGRCSFLGQEVSDSSRASYSTALLTCGRPHGGDDARLSAQALASAAMQWRTWAALTDISHRDGGRAPLPPLRCRSTLHAVPRCSAIQKAPPADRITGFDSSEQAADHRLSINEQELIGDNHTHNRRVDMLIHPAFQPVVALVAGILILMMPRLLNYIVAIYLIVIGVLGLLHRTM
jgi:hypothetical protein